MSSSRVVFTHTALFAVALYLVLAGTQAERNEIAFASNIQLNITNSTQDYIIENQRQYNNNIVAMDADLIVSKSIFENQLGVIDTQTDMLVLRILALENKLNPLERLADIPKHCVQKYRGQIPVINDVQTNIGNCVSAANYAYKNLVIYPTNTKTQLDNFYKLNLNNMLKNCKSQYVNVEKYTICVMDAIEVTDEKTALLQKQFNLDMFDLRNAGNKQVRLAVDCSFEIVYKTIEALSEVSKLVNVCEHDLYYSPKMNLNSRLNQNSSSYCPYEFNLALGSADYRSATITNPFYGLSETVSCVKINLVNSTQLKVQN